MAADNKQETAGLGYHLQPLEPRNGVYVFSRYDDINKVMIALNKNKEDVGLDMNHFKEVLGDAKKGRDIISGLEFTIGDKLTIPARSPMVIEID